MGKTFTRPKGWEKKTKSGYDRGNKDYTGQSYDDYDSSKKERKEEEEEDKIKKKGHGWSKLSSFFAKKD